MPNEETRTAHRGIHPYRLTRDMQDRFKQDFQHEIGFCASIAGKTENMKSKQTSVQIQIPKKN